MLGALGATALLGAVSASLQSSTASSADRFAGWRAVLGDPAFARAVRFTITITLASTAVATVLALVLAVALALPLLAVCVWLSVHAADIGERRVLLLLQPDGDGMATALRRLRRGGTMGA